MTDKGKAGGEETNRQAACERSKGVAKMLPSNVKLLDCWVNPNPPETPKGHFARDDYLFKDVAARATIEELIKEMDECNEEKALLCASPRDPFRASTHHRDPWSDLEYVLGTAEKYPERFSVSVRVQPREGMDALRKLETLVKSHGVVAAKVSAHSILAPYDDKMYYPVYAKCIELGIPITINVGIPHPMVPGKYQDPIALDEVCWFFPELKIVMTHMGEPWVGMVVKLLLKWPNIFLMTSAFAPKYYPKELIDFMNTRGSDKVMFASDWPLVTMRRCASELKELPLRDHVWPKFLRENAARVFDWKTRAKSGAPFD